MSNKPADRSLRFPPDNLSGMEIPRTRQPARSWFRVHQSRYPAVYFSLNTRHRYSHKECQYPLLYVGVDLDTCLFERFGDRAYDNQKAINESRWNSHRISTIQVPGLHVCDLTNAKTLSTLMVDLSALMHNEIATPQEWGLAIQRHPANFQAIKFKSRFNGKACLALFQRDGIENRLHEIPGANLADDDAAEDWLDKHKVSLY
jgi:RES domain